MNTLKRSRKAAPPVRQRLAAPAPWYRHRMPSTATRALAGVDGCRGGWVVAWDGGLEVLPTFADIVARRFDLVLVDIPIGLLDTGPRRCDVEARSLIGARRSSVFPAPSRHLLRARRYAGQCSAQLWNILDKIREVDESMKPSLQR